MGSESKKHCFSSPLPDEGLGSGLCRLCNVRTVPVYCMVPGISQVIPQRNWNTTNIEAGSGGVYCTVRRATRPNNRNIKGQTKPKSAMPGTAILCILYIGRKAAIPMRPVYRGRKYASDGSTHSTTTSNVHRMSQKLLHHDPGSI